MGRQHRVAGVVARRQLAIGVGFSVGACGRGPRFAMPVSTIVARGGSRDAFLADTRGRGRASSPGALAHVVGPQHVGSGVSPHLFCRFRIFTIFFAYEKNGQQWRRVVIFFVSPCPTSSMARPSKQKGRGNGAWKAVDQEYFAGNGGGIRPGSNKTSKASSVGAAASLIAQSCPASPRFAPRLVFPRRSSRTL